MEQNESPNRGKWKNKTESILSCVGYAVGFGNVWRFPYLAYKNGGGAGYAIVVLNAISSTYCNIVNTYPLMFLTYAFKDPLPWSACGNPWNTKDCRELKVDGPMTQTNDSSDRSMNKTLVKTPADEFFHLEILKMSSGIEETGSIDPFLLSCNIFAWLIVFLCIMKGIKSVGKVVYFTALFPFVVLFCLLIRGLTLPGAWDGVYFYIWPKWDQLTDLKVWAAAAIQIFFSLGPGWGGLVNIFSYNDFKNNCKLDSIVVPLVNCGTSILAGFVVFSVIGFMAHETGMPISRVATEGPGLAFITYPAAISLMPWPNLWAILFFFMLYNIGLDTLFVFVETSVCAIVDDFPYLRKFQFYVTLGAVLLVASFSVLYCTNAGMYWLQLFDWYVSSMAVALICLSEVIIIGWIYGVKRFAKDVEFMTGEKISWYWILSWKIITPACLTFILATVIAFNARVSYMGHEFPEWAIQIGWVSCSVSILCIPLYMVYRLLFIEKGDLIQRVKRSLTPLPSWGPSKPQDRSKWSHKTLGCDVEDPSQQKLVTLRDNEDNK
ncbi:unnamed protein product [Acanthoscelides obtectus]|uniref:Transporter n=1 Tax=Acanthoscelides obtectus TaxID=200917 RepID=A0A9P0LHR0_ACAOB|nr:unnamed protein product [Acanthoscelides obtectus]CAK1637627.1 Sodium- and chloride-dependent glycine transporter 2 [Acanthoscelides obtectus]